MFGWLFPNRKLLREVLRKLEGVDMKLSSLAGQLGSIDAQLTKAQSEIIAKIDELETALVDVEIPPEAEAALMDLKNKAQGLDDIVPDVAPPVTPEPPSDG